MTNRHLKIFLSVCENGNMTKAAKAMYMTQPAVSQAVKELEAYYETELFERFNKKLYLTKKGEELQVYAKRIINLFVDAEDALKARTHSVIKIGANISAGTSLMPRYIKQFNETSPNVDIIVSVAGSKKLESMLMDNVLDFALFEDRVLDASLEAEPFYHDKTVVVVSPDSRIAAKKSLTVDKIKNERFLLREKGAGVRDIFDYLMFLKNINIEPYWESVSTEALVEAVKAGIGIAVLPYLPIKRYLDSGEIKELIIRDLPLERNLNIVRNKNKIQSEFAEAFIEMVRSRKNKLASAHVNLV